MTKFVIFFNFVECFRYVTYQKIYVCIKSDILAYLWYSNTFMTYQQDVGIVKVKSMLSGEKCDILTYPLQSKSVIYL